MLPLICLLLGTLAVGPQVADPAEPGPQPKAAPPAAVVCLVRGGVVAVAPGEPRPRPVASLDLLPLDTVVRTTPDGRAVVVLTDGRRFEVQGNSVARVTSEELEVSQGAVLPLPPVPAVAALAPLRADEWAGGQSAVGRFRSPAADQDRDALGLAPPNGATVPAAPLELRFTPPERYSAFRVEVETGWGKRVFETVTSESSVTVPADVLEPETTYRWQVRTRDRGRPSVSASAVFFTLPEAQGRAREALAAQARSGHDPSLMVLLAGVDAMLGLPPTVCVSLADPDDSDLEDELAKVRDLLGCGATGP